MHGVGSRNKLTPSHARHYPGPELLDVLGRALCTAHCLPRKELHEAWEMAIRVRPWFRGGRVVDLCAGAGLLGQVMLLLDDTSPRAIAVDVKLPKNHDKVHGAMLQAFPILSQRVHFQQASLNEVVIAADDIVVSAHACGPLTDAILDKAADAGARVAVLPCCHAHRFRADLAGCEDPSGAIDKERMQRLRGRAYRVWDETIPVEVSPKNRILFGAPSGF